MSAVTSLLIWSSLVGIAFVATIILYARTRADLYALNQNKWNGEVSLKMSNGNYRRHLARNIFYVPPNSKIVSVHLPSAHAGFLPLVTFRAVNDCTPVPPYRMIPHLGKGIDIIFDEPLGPLDSEEGQECLVIDFEYDYPPYISTFLVQTAKQGMISFPPPSSPMRAWIS